MKRIRHIRIVLLFIMVVFIHIFSAEAQTVTIWNEDFGSYTNNTGIEGPGNNNIGDYPASVSKWSIITTGANLLNATDYLKVSNNIFQARDLHGKGIWLTESIDISSFFDISVSADFRRYSGTMEGTDSINFYYRIDNGAWNAIVLLNDDISTSAQNYSVSGLNGNNLEVKVEVILNNGGLEVYAFDNVLVEGVPTSPPLCTTPDLPADGQTGVYVNQDLTWNASPGATGYYLYLGTDAGATNILNGVDVGNITTYNPSSDFNYSTDYFWRVIPYNSVGTASGCSTWSFTTGACSAGSSTEDEYIDRVTIGTIDNNNSGYSPNGYGDFTQLSTDITQGESNVQIELTYGVAYYDDDIGIWVDWNQDGDFDDVNENVVCHVGISSTGESFIFDVPSDAVIGSTIIRIRFKYYNSDCGHPCGVTQYGEVEDYTLNVTPACAVSVFDVTGGGSFCTGDAGVAVGLTGSQSGVDYQLYVDGVPAGSLVTGTGNAISFGLQNISGTYTVIATESGTGCEVNMAGSALITEVPYVPDFTAQIINSTCGNSDGSVLIDISTNPSVEFANADGDYIDLGSSFMSNLSEFTLEGWIKFDKNNISGTRVGSLFGQNDAIEFGVYSSTTIQCWTSGGGSASVNLSGYPSDNDWHHVAVVGNGSSIIIYIDGVVAGSGGNSTGNYGSSSYSAKIGGGIWDPTGGSFEGQMRKAGFWNIALSQAEISQLASEYTNYTGTETGLIAGYNFSEGSGTSISSAPPGNNGSFVNSPVWVNDVTYSWTKTGDGSFSSSEKNITNVSDGEYNLTVSNGTCSRTKSFSVNYLDNEDPQITCPSAILVNPDPGLCNASGIDLGTPSTSDNCSVASVINDAVEPYEIGDNIIIWTVTDNAGNTATCQQTVTVEPSEIIDIRVEDLGNSCQSGETGTQTAIIWDITKITGDNNWSFDYVINDGTNDIESGTKSGLTGSGTQVSFAFSNATGIDKTFTITLTNVQDNCTSEQNTTNNSDSVTMHGLPNTSEIISN